MTPGAALPESRYTGPTANCPYPDRWHSTDDHSTEVEVSELVAAFVRALQPDLVFETGAAWGQTSELIGRALVANGQGFLVTTEPDAERADYTVARCEGLPVVVRQHGSLEWEPPGPIQFAFFDSLWELRISEFLHVRPFLKAGTVVCWHDTAPGHGQGTYPGGRDLRQEIDTVLAGQVRTIHLPTPRGVTFAEVL
jgi:predicted O-methyltransferase YrrM